MGEKEERDGEERRRGDKEVIKRNSPLIFAVASKKGVKGYDTTMEKIENVCLHYTGGE